MGFKGAASGQAAVIPDKCQSCRNKAAWIGIAVNLGLVVAKAVVGVASGSKACLADALHSTANIITATAIWVTQKLTRKQADVSFNHGYGKAEFLAAGFVSFFILSAALALITASIRHLISGASPVPGWSAVGVALISICANEMLFRYMRCVGTRVKSQTILANAWANRADSFSSMAVIVGVVGARLGIDHLDPICAMVVVVVIVRISAKILVDSVKSLMDVSVNHIYGREIHETSRGIQGVVAVSDLRTRQIGAHVWAEVNIHIDPLAKLKQGQVIADRVREGLLARIPDLENVLVHIRPARVRPKGATG